MINIWSVAHVLKWVIVLAIVFGAWYVVFVADQSAAQIDITHDEPQIRYIPPDEIEWFLESSNNDEIITIDPITESIWDFYITPNPSRLSADEIKNYPFELFRIAYTGAEPDATKYKVPISVDDYTVQTIPTDIKSTSPKIVTSDQQLDLTVNSGFTLYADPERIAGAHLKLSTHSATYTAITNTVVVTGSPVSYQDVYDSLLAAHPGTTPFHQLGTQQFHSTAKIYYGDDSTTTGLIDRDVQLSLASGINGANFNILQQIESNAVVRLDNCSIIDEDNIVRGNKLFNDSDGVLQISNSQITKLKESGSDRGLIEGFGTSSYLDNCYTNNIAVALSNMALRDCVMENALFPIYRPGSGAIFDNITSAECSYGIGLGGDTQSVITNANIDGNSNDIYSFNTTVYSTFINTAMSSWDSFCSGVCVGGGVNRTYTLDMLVQSGSGVPIVNENVTIQTVGGTVVYSGVTSASGTIPQQTLYYGTYATGTTTAVMHTPHTLQITANGYQDYTTTVYVDEQKSLEIAMLPISSGTTAGDVITYLEDNMELFAVLLLAGVALAILIFTRVKKEE